MAWKCEINLLPLHSKPIKMAKIETRLGECFKFFTKKKTDISAKLFVTSKVDDESNISITIEDKYANDFWDGYRKFIFTEEMEDELRNAVEKCEKLGYNLERLNFTQYSSNTYNNMLNMRKLAVITNEKVVAIKLEFKEMKKIALTSKRKSKR